MMLIDQNVSSDDRDFFPDPEICLVVVGILQARVGDGWIRFCFEIVDQNCVPLSTFSLKNKPGDGRLNTRWNGNILVLKINW